MLLQDLQVGPEKETPLNKPSFSYYNYKLKCNESVKLAAAVCLLYEVFYTIGEAYRFGFGQA